MRELNIIGKYIEGNFSYRALASPILHNLILDVTQSVRQTANESAFDRWLKNDPNSDKSAPK